MKILKRDGTYEELSFDKILFRMKTLKNYNFTLNNVDVDTLTQKVISRIYDGVSSQELDEFAAQLAIENRFESIEYEILATRIIISNLHKKTPKLFSEAMEILYKNGKLNEKFINAVRKNQDIFDSAICYEQDYTYDYFAFKTLEKSYLLKINNTTNSTNTTTNATADIIIETPQYLLMRVSIALHYNLVEEDILKEDSTETIENILNTYELLSQKYFTHASPTLYNAGTHREQLASCFLLGIEDSMAGIYKCISDCALISKYAGGIGVHISNIRGSGSLVRGTNGRSDGISNMLRVFDATALYANQGSRRKGSIAIYIEPWHSDINEFLELPLKHGDEKKRARDLFYALWVPDLFMKQVESDGDWWLMSPDESPNLTNVYGDEFDKLYMKYVEDGTFRKKIKARQLWDKILTTQIETGLPYISYKDTVNERSNQKNIGVIKSSNLCNEINIYSDEKEYGTCNLASISLPAFIKNGEFDFNKLESVVEQIVINLNKIIDNSFYPVKEAEYSNKKNRPIGIGVQGFANCLYELKIPFESSDAKNINVMIFETIYYSALKASCDLAIKYGPYSTFEGSPFSKGIFQFDYKGKHLLTGRYDWDDLRQKVIKNGTRNSLLTACMPTASTSNILNNFESFEPATHNIFIRKVISGEYSVVNRHLIKDLQDLKLWDSKMFNEFKKHYGSIQKIKEIPDNLKLLYKDVYEVSQKTLIELSADRQHFIDQSQSLNIYFNEPTIRKLTSMHFYGWKAGLKTGMYYLRTSSASEAAQFTVSNTNGNTTANSTESVEEDSIKTIEAKLMCSLLNKDECDMCSG